MLHHGRRDGPTTLSELIAANGDDNIEFHYIAHRLISPAMNDAVTKNNCGIGPIYFLAGLLKHGVVVWMDGAQ